jgi:hypothetical protein
MVKPNKTSPDQTSPSDASGDKHASEDKKDPRRRGMKACCLVSEMLQEMGLDAEKAKEIRRQALIGMMTFCQWQLARMGDEPRHPPDGGPRKTRGRRVKVV